jgi:hypothetical protein
MDTKYQGFPGGQDRIVYIRAVAVADLPEDLRQQADGIEILYAVHRPNGDRLALVANKGLAFALSRQNDLVPLSVH